MLNHTIFSDHGVRNVMAQNSYIAPYDDQHAIVIPIDPNTLGGFIGSLLGRPQTIENSFLGHFDLDRKHIENVFHLVDQRIRQQNKGTLVQFTVTIMYADESSVLLNSIDDFINYSEVRPQVSVSADLSWTYLIHFEDKLTPEKQVIELSIRTRRIQSFDSVEFLIMPSLKKVHSNFTIRIQHTARSWGVDVEHLLIGQIKSWIREEHWIKKAIYQHAGWVGFFFGLVFFALACWSTYEVTEHVLSTLKGTVEVTKALSTEKKLDYLITMAVEAPAITVQNYKGMGYVGSFIVSVLVGLLIANQADNPPKNYLVLSEASKNARIESLGRRTRDWAYFMLSGLTSTIAGLLSRYLFAMFFGG